MACALLGYWSDVDVCVWPCGLLLCMASCFLPGKRVVKARNARLGVVILMWVFSEYSAHSVQLWLLQTAAAPVTGIQIPSLLSGETQDTQADSQYNMILISYEKNILNSLLSSFKGTFNRSKSQVTVWILILKSYWKWYIHAYFWQFLYCVYEKYDWLSLIQWLGKRNQDQDIHNYQMINKCKLVTFSTDLFFFSYSNLTFFFKS